MIRITKVYSMYIFFDSMASRITKWGNSLGVRIPKVLAEQAGIADGTIVDIRQDGDQIVIQKLALPSYRLADLLAEIRDENIHDEISTGNPVGKEVW